MKTCKPLAIIMLLSLAICIGCKSGVTPSYVSIKSADKSDYPFRLEVHTNYTANFNVHAMKAERTVDDMVTYVYVKRRYGVLGSDDFAVGWGKEGPDLTIAVRGVLTLTDGDVLITLSYKAVSMKNYVDLIVDARYPIRAER